jgi:hypothetical protein
MNIFMYLKYLNKNLDSAIWLLKPNDKFTTDHIKRLLLYWLDLKKLFDCRVRSIENQVFWLFSQLHVVGFLRLELHRIGKTGRPLSG